MDDERIVRLYWDRNEQAISESASKYGAYCVSIAHNILLNWADTEECVNDTWLHAWNAMPPHRPSMLGTFLGKITRNLAFDLYKKLHRDKRGGQNIDLVLDELAEIVSGKDDPESIVQEKELKDEINHFLSGLSEEKKNMFILRYWYADEIKEIAKRCGMSENNVSVTLSRTRRKLKDYLTERGYSI
jgi:RNA polymerase sigma-70 factor (ECF subfamily)